MNRGRRVAAAGAALCLVAVSACSPVSASPLTEPGSVPAGTAPFSVVVLPDTQEYVATEDGALIIEAQTRWIHDNLDEYAISLVLHEGDLVDNVHCPAEWDRVSAALSVLTVPYLTTTGNHDLIQYREGCRGSAPVDWRYVGSDVFAEHFPLSVFEGFADQGVTVGGTFEGRADNAWYRVNAGGIEFRVLVLEFGPRDEAVAWASGVLAADPDLPTVLLTHDYLGDDDELRGSRDCSVYPPSVTCLPEDALPGTPGHTWMPSPNTGFDLWQKLVEPNPSIVLVLSGHVARPEVRTVVDGVPVTVPSNDRTGGVSGLRITDREDGSRVAQMMANYQNMMPSGGAGYLRLLTVDPATGTVQVRTFSPWLNLERRDADSAFTISDLDWIGAGQP